MGELFSRMKRSAAAGHIKRFVASPAFWNHGAVGTDQVLSHVIKGSGGTGDMSQKLLAPFMWALCHQSIMLSDLMTSEDFSVVPAVHNRDVVLQPVLSPVDSKGHAFNVVDKGMFLTLCVGCVIFKCWHSCCGCRSDVFPLGTV